MNARAISGLSTGAFLVTVGAILYFAVTASVDGFDVNAAGAILMAVGFTVALVAVIWGLMVGSAPRRTHVVETTRVARPAAPAQPVVQAAPPQKVVVESRPAPPPVDQT